MRAGLWTGFFLLEERTPSLNTVQKEIDRLRAAGFSCGELDERNAHALFVSCTQEEADAHAHALAQRRFFTQAHAPKPVEDIRQQILCESRMIRACGIMRVKTLVTHPFAAKTYAEEPVEKNVACLARYAGAAAENGVRLALENQIYPVSMDVYLKRVPQLGVNVDFAHALATQVDVCGMIQRYAGRLFGVHAADSDGRPEDYHVMPGAGVLRWDEIITALGKAGYDGDMHLEIVHERSADPQRNDETARKAFEVTHAMLGARMRPKESENVW